MLMFRVRTGPGKPGKSWKFRILKSRPGKPGKYALVLESPGKLDFPAVLRGPPCSKILLFVSG